MAVLTNEELEDLMRIRGEEKLSEHVMFENVDGTVITNGTKFVYGEDFNLGDYVSVYSKKMNKMLTLQVTSVTKTISNGVEYTDIGFGDDIIRIANMK